MIRNDALLAHFENKLNTHYQNSYFMKIKGKYELCKLYDNFLYSKP